MENLLSNFDKELSIAIIGATGGIGGALIDVIAKQPNTAKIFAFSRKKPESDTKNTQWIEMDVTREESIKIAVQEMGDVTLDIIINATGILSVGDTSPERSLRDIDMSNFEKVFAVNTHAPALIMKHFLPLLDKNRKSIFANLSARVGSITDNQLGGWYAYRASKSALNMLIKTASIEVARRNKTALVIGLHPGTVDTTLSNPFKANVPEDKLFTPEFSATALIKVINNLNASNTGKCYDWQGENIEP